MIGGTPAAAAMAELPIGRAVVRRESSRRHHRVAMLAFGSMVAPALAAAETLDATVVDMRFVKPLDVELLLRIATEHAGLVTIEENVIAGGAGSAVAEALAAAGRTVPLLHLGLPDRFPDHGEPAAILRECGLDGPGIAQSIQKRFAPPDIRPVAKPAA